MLQEGLKTFKDTKPFGSPSYLDESNEKDCYFSLKSILSNKKVSRRRKNLKVKFRDNVTIMRLDASEMTDDHVKQIASGKIVDKEISFVRKID